MATTTKPDYTLGRRVYRFLSAIPTWVLWGLVVLWSVPTVGLFVNSFRDRNAQRGGGWWTISPGDLTIDNYIDERRMIYMVVGDGETQLKRIVDLGYGEPIHLDIQGNPLQRRPAPGIGPN